MKKIVILTTLVALFFGSETNARAGGISPLTLLKNQESNFLYNLKKNRLASVVLYQKHAEKKWIKSDPIGYNEVQRKFKGHIQQIVVAINYDNSYSSFSPKDIFYVQTTDGSIYYQDYYPSFVPFRGASFYKD